MEVRPIDAEALKAIFEEDGHLSAYIEEYIDDTPTLDYAPVRHGTWEWYEEPYDSRNPDGNYGWRCSCCKQDLAAELTLGIPRMHYAYDVLDDPDNPPTIKRCLFCGAKMKEDEKDENT